MSDVGGPIEHSNIGGSWGDDKTKAGRWSDYTADEEAVTAYVANLFQTGAHEKLTCEKCGSSSMSVGHDTVGGEPVMDFFCLDCGHVERV